MEHTVSGEEGMRAVGSRAPSQYPPMPRWYSPQSPSPVHVEPPASFIGHSTEGQSAAVITISVASCFRKGATHSVRAANGIHPLT